MQVARSTSAYDMTISDATYGEVPRYVTEERLDAMLEHEYLTTVRGALANTYESYTPVT